MSFIDIFTWIVLLITIATVVGVFVLMGLWPGKNAINRFKINSYMLEQKQLNVENGKLTIYVQNEKPTDPKQLKNWLPAPKGEFRFTARFYGPKMSIIDGSYKMPQLVKVK